MALSRHQLPMLCTEGMRPPRITHSVEQTEPHWSHLSSTLTSFKHCRVRTLRRRRRRSSPSPMPQLAQVSVHLLGDPWTPPLAEKVDASNYLAPWAERSSISPRARKPRRVRLLSSELANGP